MRILGIDPGSNATGYGVVDSRAGRLLHVAHGTWRPRRGQPLAARLASLHAALVEVIGVQGPDRVVVEQAFVSASPRAALVLGHARGVVLAAAAAAGLAVEEIAPREVKQAVVGTGTAAKHQVQAMVQRLLDLELRPPQDAADALAAAICRAHRGALAGLALRRPARRPARRPRGGFVLRRAP